MHHEFIEMEALLSTGKVVLMTIGTVALPFLAEFLIYRARLARVLPIVRRVFEVADPFLNEHLAFYSRSQISFALNLITGVLADGKLSLDEVKFAAEEIQRRFKPELSAGKVYETLSDETLKRLTDVVEKGMEDGRFTTMELAEAIKVVAAEVI